MILSRALIIILIAVFVQGCQKSEARKPTPEEEKLVAAARQASISTCEHMLGRSLTAQELDCVHVDFDGTVRGSISSPLKEELEQRQAQLSKSSGGPGSAPNSTSPPAGMTKYKYLAADGGPHIVLPAAAAATWRGASSQADVTNPNSDYGRACAATQNAQFAVISAGGAASAIVIQNPPMSATGTAPDGSIDVYDLQSFKTTNLDALLDKACAMAPSAFVDSGKVLPLPAPDAFLMFAGDTPTSTAYGVIQIKISAGQYRILVGNYANAGESVTVYRLKSKVN